MKKISQLFISTLLMIVVVGCGKNKPLPGSYERIMGNTEGTIADTVLTLETGSEKYYSKLINTSDSNELLLGNYEQYKSGIYLQFVTPGDSLHIKSADLVLSVKGKTAPGDSSLWDSSPQATVNVFLADTSWDETNPPTKDWSLQLSSATIYSDSTHDISIALDSTLLNQWNDDESNLNNFGFWLESEETRFMQIYHSFESLDTKIMPRMNLSYSYVDSQGVTIDTNKVIYVSDDAFVLLNSEQDLNLDADLLYIGKGLAFHDVFKFSFDFLDSTIHINRAMMELTINKSNSIRELAYLDDAILYGLSEEWTEGTEIDEQKSLNYMGTIADSLLIFNVTTTVQTVVDNKNENYGFFMKSQHEEETISRIAFYSSKSNFDLQPKLKIYYSTPTK